MTATTYVSPFPALRIDEHMRLVGVISAHWEFLDVTLQRALAEVMMHDFSRVAQLTENVPFRAKMDLLMAYVRPLQDEKPDMWKEYTALHNEVLTAYGLRNRFVHARWKEGHHPDVPMRVVTRSAGGRFTIEDEDTCTCHMSDAAQSIHNTGEKLMRFFQKCGLFAS